MKITVTEYRELARDDLGNVLPLGRDVLQRTTQTAFASFTSHAEAEFARVATDTQMTFNSDLIPAGGVEFFKIVGGASQTTAAA